MRNLGFKIKKADLESARRSSMRQELVESGFYNVPIHKVEKDRKKDASRKACRKFKYKD